MIGTGDVMELLRKCSLNILIEQNGWHQETLDLDRILWKTLKLKTSLKDVAVV